MHMGSGACICFVDECEFKVAVLRQRRMENHSIRKDFPQLTVA